MADSALQTTATPTVATATKNGSLLHLDQIVYFSLSINLLAIVAGNIALLVFVASKPKSRMTYFITNLAVADLCVGLCFVLPQFIDRVLMQFYGPEVLCKLKFFAQGTVSYGAAYALVVLSIDRVDAISNPLKASTSRRRSQTASLIAGSWLLSAACSSPTLIWAQVRQHRQFGRQCSISYSSGANTTRLEKQHFWQIYVTTNLVTIIIIPVTIVAVCHAVLIVIIYRSGLGQRLHGEGSSAVNGGGSSAGAAKSHRGGAAAQQQLRRDSGRRNTITRAKIKTVKVTCTIVSVFILCWLPYTIGNFLDIFHVARLSIYVKAFIQTLGTLNSAANPIIFFIFNHNQCCGRAADPNAQRQRVNAAAAASRRVHQQQQQLHHQSRMLQLQKRQALHQRDTDVDGEAAMSCLAQHDVVADAVIVGKSAKQTTKLEVLE